MNQKELNEIRRRFRLDKNNFSRIFGCYVNSNREVISWIDASLGLMRQEEQEMYLGLLKKTLSGTLGRNLIDIAFSTAQVADSDEHRLLQTLRQTECKDANARETLCRKIIESLNMGETNCLILLAADAYDVPYRGKDDELQADASGDVYKYFVCAICPVKAPTLELRYDTDENFFHPSSTGHIALAPELGFLFPAFDDRTANIYNALLYTRAPDQVHHEFIAAVFHTEPPLSAAEQREGFQAALSGALDDSFNMEVVQAVHEQLLDKIEQHKESKDPEPLTVSVQEVAAILKDCGVADTQVAAFEAQCGEQFGDGVVLNPENIIDSKHFEVKTADASVAIDPKHSYIVETRIIDGRKYLLIPADEGVEVNGMAVGIAAADRRE